MGEIIDRSKGQIKQAVGNLTGNEKLEREGERDEAEGKLKGAIADIKGAAKDTKQALVDSLKPQR